jgi:hypothetical protein
MESLLADIDFTSTLFLSQIMVWMDGGSVTLELADRNSTEFTVEFCQTMSLKKYPQLRIPGSFLFNGIEIPIRSNDEQIILNALRELRLSDNLLTEEQRLPKHLAYRAIIDEQIAFVKSNKYLAIAKEMGRL